MLDEGLVHIVSSDTHSPTWGRSPKMEEACKLIEKEYGKENAIKLFYDNAIHVIKNEEVVNLTKVEKSFLRNFLEKVNIDICLKSRKNQAIQMLE